jgi:hypothetical protein
MDKGYTTIVLDFYFVIMEKITSSNHQMIKSGGCSYFIFCSPCLALSVIAP